MTKPATVPAPLVRKGPVYDDAWRESMRADLARARERFGPDVREGYTESIALSLSPWVVSIPKGRPQPQHYPCSHYAAHYSQYGFEEFDEAVLFQLKHR